MIREINIGVRLVKKRCDLNGVDALIIPRGGSTAISALMKYRNLIELVVKLIKDDIPILGTRAGAVLLVEKKIE